MWTYNFFVHKVFCDDVIAHEELVFIVKNAEITRERGPEWSARIECFSIGSNGRSDHIQAVWQTGLIPVWMRW